VENLGGSRAKYQAIILNCKELSDCEGFVSDVEWNNNIVIVTNMGRERGAMCSVCFA
jgi:hypothetical protein